MSDILDTTQPITAGTHLNRAIFRKKAVIDREAIRRQVKEFLAKPENKDIDPKRWRRHFTPSPVWKSTDYVTISGGDRNNIIDREATRRDKETYHAQYQAFLRNASQEAVSGVTLKAWAILDPTAKITEDTIEALHFHKIYSVEQIVGCPDSNIPNLAGFRELQRKADDFLAIQRQGAPAALLNAELRKRDAEIADGKAKYAELEAKLAALAARADGEAPAPKRKGGRPRKAQAEAVE